MKNKKNVMWIAAALALSLGGFSAAKIYSGRNAMCDSSGADGMKDCDHHKQGDAAKTVSAGSPEAGKLPDGHPDISAPGKTSAPPLDDKVMAKGKSADCPYLSQAETPAAPKSQKDKTVLELEAFVLGQSPEGGKAR